MTDRETLEGEIAALDRIVVTNKAALKLKTLTTSDRNLLKLQIEARGTRLTALRRRLDDLVASRRQ